MKTNVRHVQSAKDPIPMLVRTGKPPSSGRTFGQRLRALREASGIGQERIAAAAGIRTMTLVEIELDRTSPQRATRASRAAVFGLRSEARRGWEECRCGGSAYH